MVDHTMATITRNGHVMPPGRTSVARMGQTQGGAARGGAQDVGGMLVGDDNRLYGAAYPGSPLDVARIRPHSATPAFRPLSSNTPGHHSHLANNGKAGSLSNRVTYMGAQHQRANSTPRDRGMAPGGAGGGGAGGGGAGGGGAGGAAAARSVSTNRGGGGAAAAAATAASAAAAAASAAATAAAAAPPSSSRPSRSAAQQRIASSAGMSLLDRSLPAVRAAAALEEELAAVRGKLTEAREEQRKAVAAVRRLECELQEERGARVRLEDQLAAISRGRGRVVPASSAASAAWADPNSPGAHSSERRVYTREGRASVAAPPAAAATGTGDWDDEDGYGAAASPAGGGGGGGCCVVPRARPASASAASSHLVSSLRWEVRQLTATRDALAAQLADVKAGSRAQRLQELQSEVERYREEVGRQMGLVRLMSGRLDAAETEAAEARAALASSQEQAAEANTGAVPLALPPGNNLSRTSVRSALVVLQRAHKLIMAEARLVKSTFPPLLTLPELRDLAVQRPNTAGAAEALMFLTSHLARLMDEVRGLPGVPRLRGPPTAAEAREAAAASAATLGGPRPSGSGALDVDAQLASLSKMGLGQPGAGAGAGSIASIKAARAAAAVRANAIAAAARAAPAPPSSRGTPLERPPLGGRLSPGRTSRPSSARTRGSAATAAAAAAVVSGEASRLNRGVLLTPAAGDPAAAEELRGRLTEAVAALAAEGRELQDEAAEAAEAEAGAAAPPSDGHNSVRSSLGGEGTAAAGRSAGRDAPAAGGQVEGEEPPEAEAAAEGEVEAEALVREEQEDGEEGALLVPLAVALFRKRRSSGAQEEAPAAAEEEEGQQQGRAEASADDGYGGYGAEEPEGAAGEDGGDAVMAEAEGYADGDGPPAQPPEEADSAIGGGGDGDEVEGEEDFGNAAAAPDGGVHEQEYGGANEYGGGGTAAEEGAGDGGDGYGAAFGGAATAEQLAEEGEYGAEGEECG
ncbi:hypothetical protein PLESTF_001630600 [Pleodorina starrii]|nr:hypothetical protein PLESTF_001630600 [Pleodorina starrii]